ncbi:MAG: hypothetical protein K2P88_06205 [Chitinophagaceae bacterium]|uniref:hypothetical protein n=1 Tax=unclassified Paraflavitalea TaxID=2798305 RepID=UPI003D33080B|nr:hypothetical protein [Chitinophagaceae bacterium]
MRISYSAFHDWSFKQVDILKHKGVECKEGYSKIVFDKNSFSSSIISLLDEWKVKYFVATDFEKKDYLSSDYFVYVGLWENGYPQPEDVEGYVNAVYDTKNLCRKCGIGAIQKSSFTLKREPLWKKRKLFELIWVLDEIFVEIDFYGNIFKPLGIACKNVKLLNKSGVASNVVQLVIPQTKTTLNLEATQYEMCTVCNSKKYSPQIEGFFPKFKDAENLNYDIFKTTEFFGSGAEAHNKIIVSKKLRDMLFDNLQYVKSWPVLK